MDDVRILFGRRVRELRKAQGFTQEDFAMEVELDRSYVSDVERGTRNISILNIEKIAKGLHVTISELTDFPQCRVLR